MPDDELFVLTTPWASSTPKVTLKYSIVLCKSRCLLFYFHEISHMEPCFFLK